MRDIRQTQLRGVFFDLDRTLLDRDTSIHSFAISQFDVFSPRLDGIERNVFVDSFIRLDARGSVWKDLVYQELTRVLGIHSVTWEELFADFQTRITDHYVAFPHLHSTLQELARHYRLGLITNGKTDFQNRTIATLGIASYFSVILISETEGVRKPDPEIFQRALRKLDLLARDTVYVGDHPHTDVRAAREAGMLAFWKRNDDFTDVACDEALDDLSELPALLRKYQI